MAEIEIEGLGAVEIEGDTPTLEEETAIIRALEGGGPPVAPAVVPSQIPAAAISPEIGTAPPGPSFRQAEEESLRALQTNLPEINRMLQARGGLTDVTGGFATRPAFTMAGGTAGGAAGAAGGAFLGTPGGPPGMAIGGTAGLLGGATMGAAAGSLMFDSIDDVVRFFRGTQRERDVFDPTFRAIQEAREEFMFTAAAGSLGPFIRRIKPVAGKLLGVGKEGARRIADLAEAQQIPIGVIQATKSKAVKGVSRVLGVFPFVNVPFRKASETATQAVDARFNDILNTLAPNATVSDLGVDLTKAAETKFGKFRRVAGALYKRFDDLAASASVPDFVPTENVRRLANELITRAEEGRIALRSGETLKAPSADQVQDFLGQLSDLPERMTVIQARELQRTLQNLIGSAGRDGFDIGRLVDAKKALEVDLNNPLVDLLPREEADTIVDSLNKANDFYASTIKRFQTPTAGKFGRVDRNIFKSGAFKAGSVNEDELFASVFSTKSPQALDDLRALVGAEQFRSTGRTFLNRSFNQSISGVKGRSVAFNADDFAQRIGLTTDDGRKSLQKMLKGSLVTVKEMENFVDVTRAAGSFTVPDVSVFLQRRLTLTGLRNIAGGLTMLAGAGVNPVATAAAVLMARQAGKILTNPAQLRLMTRVLDETIPNQQRRALLLRLGRLVLDGSDEPEAGAETTGLTPALP